MLAGAPTSAQKQTPHVAGFKYHSKKTQLCFCCFLRQANSFNKRLCFICLLYKKRMLLIIAHLGVNNGNGFFLSVCFFIFSAYRHRTNLQITLNQKGFIVFSGFKKNPACICEPVNLKYLSNFFKMVCNTQVG